MKSGININLSDLWTINSDHGAKYKTNTVNVDMNNGTENMEYSKKMNIEHERWQKIE